MDKQEIICGIVAIIVIVAVAIGWIMFSTAQYQKAEENLPSEYDIEEELEYHLASTDVIIIDTEQDEDVLIAKVWANGGIFRAEYRIDNYIFDFYWKLVDVKMVGVGERP